MKKLLVQPVSITMMSLWYKFQITAFGFYTQQKFNDFFGTDIQLWAPVSLVSFHSEMIKVHNQKLV